MLDAAVPNQISEPGALHGNSTLSWSHCLPCTDKHFTHKRAMTAYTEKGVMLVHDGKNWLTPKGPVSQPTHQNGRPLASSSHLACNERSRQTSLAIGNSISGTMQAHPGTTNLHVPWPAARGIYIICDRPQTFPHRAGVTAACTRG